MFLAIEKTLSSKLEDARNSVQLRIVKALKEYRNLYAVQHCLGDRIIFPESLKFLPLYGLALCRSTPLRGGYADAPLDECCSAGYTMMTLPVKKLLKLLYPSLIRQESRDEYLLKASAQVDDFKNLEKRLPLAAENLVSRGLHLYDDGFRFNIWFGRALSPDVAMNLLGADFAAELSKVFFYRWSLCPVASATGHVAMQTRVQWPLDTSHSLLLPPSVPQFESKHVTPSERDNEMSRKLIGILKNLEKVTLHIIMCHLIGFYKYTGKFSKIHSIPSSAIFVIYRGLNMLVLCLIHTLMERFIQSAPPLKFQNGSLKVAMLHQSVTLKELGWFFAIEKLNISFVGARYSLVTGTIFIN
uniref:Sec23/Sec24 helical domain-containing protein n=1 Tax=Quercus lobata TaxID=97700 RepID=A0A7N2L550_QUELO